MPPQLDLLSQLLVTVSIVAFVLMVELLVLRIELTRRDMAGALLDLVRDRPRFYFFTGKGVGKDSDGSIMYR